MLTGFFTTVSSWGMVLGDAITGAVTGHCSAETVTAWRQGKAELLQFRALPAVHWREGVGAHRRGHCAGGVV